MRGIGLRYRCDGLPRPRCRSMLSVMQICLPKKALSCSGRGRHGDDSSHSHRLKSSSWLSASSALRYSSESDVGSSWLCPLRYVAGSSDSSGGGGLLNSSEL